MIRYYEIRDPIHGFIELNEWEKEIIDHPAFQRLRRIHQLGLTSMVYPGATHTRFEHSLGVMQIATKMYDEIVKRRKDFLKSELSYTDGGLEKDRVLVRLASLLHDIGHPPFSHVTEELMPKDELGQSYRHENYSAAIVQYIMKDVIENHPLNQNYGIKAQDIAYFLNNNIRLGRSLLWRNLVCSQLDADRADYLLRDSLHIGVAYGKYDLNRLLVTMTVAIDLDEDSPVLAVEEGGEHAAEGMIIARFMMFTQVYFQHTRRAYDFHSTQAMKTLLGREQSNAKDVFPPPSSEMNIRDYIKWDDWRVLGMIHEGFGGENGNIIIERRHHRCVYSTNEAPNEQDLELFEEANDLLGDMVAFTDKAEQSWYKFEKTDIPILLRPGRSDSKLVRLSSLSEVVKGLKTVSQRRIFVSMENKKKADEIIKKFRIERGEINDK